MTYSLISMALSYVAGASCGYFVSLWLMKREQGRFMEGVGGLLTQLEKTQRVPVKLEVPRIEPLRAAVGVAEEMEASSGRMLDEWARNQPLRTGSFASNVPGKGTEHQKEGT